MCKQVKLGISARHVHVSQEHLEMLYGPGAELHPIKDLGQPGQYAADERVDLITAKGSIKGVRILGPVRKQSQVELALTDARKLGLNPPVRDSGNLKGTPGIKMVGPHGSIELTEGVIIAARHIHFDPETAAQYNLKDQDQVCVKIKGERGLTFEHVLVRVHPSFAPEMHIDTDEGNAALMDSDCMVEILVK